MGLCVCVCLSVCLPMCTWQDAGWPHRTGVTSSRASITDLQPSHTYNQVEDLIMVQLTHGAGYIPLEGAALKERIAHPSGSRPYKVRAS